MKVLLVDDESLQLVRLENACKQVLKDSTFSSFTNPLKALEESNKVTFDIAFLDIEMPQMSGFDFLDKYKKNIQIIVISASRKYALDAYDYDITDYLLKPIAYERFLVAANKAVEKHILQKHLNDEHFA